MESLMQSRIRENCKLALPNGLKELMADISREVLRARPKDLYRFIAEYLSVLLVTRDNLSIASRLCSHLCEGCCEGELYDGLRNIGLQPDDAETAESIILEHLCSEKVNEGNLLMKLMRKLDFNEELIPAIQNAVRTAFLRHQANYVTELKKLSHDDGDEVSRAAAHTMRLYSDAGTTEQEYYGMAQKNQAAYRADGVKRVEIPNEDPAVQPLRGKNDESIGTISSASLAGSYLKLPKYKPYSATDVDQLAELEETSGRDHVCIDYTTANGWKEKMQTVSAEEKRISFKEPRVRHVDDDSEGSVEEDIEVRKDSDEIWDEELEVMEEINNISAIDDIRYEMDSIASLETLEL